MTARSLYIVHTEASLGWGGQEIRILTEAAGMIARGHRVTLLCPPEARIFQESHVAGVPVEALPIGRKSIRGAMAMRRWLRIHHPDIVNTHSSTDSWLAALAVSATTIPPPLVRTRHISAAVPNNAATRWLYLRATRHIVTTGELLRRQLITHNHFPSQRITSVPTGVDICRFALGDRRAARDRLDLPQGALLIGIVATLRSWKGHRHLLEAFAQMAAPDARLVIVGGGPQQQTLEQQIAALRIGSRVLMVGNQHDVLPWLHAFDIFALPSYANEGVPQAIVQAMLTGLPVVTTPIGSITEAVAHEQTGLLVEPQNPEALRAALERLVDDEALRRRLGDAARAHAAAEFGLEAMLDKMEDVFYQVLGHG